MFYLLWYHHSPVTGKKGHTWISGLWTEVLDVGLWTLESGPWMLDAGLWTLDSRLWILDSDLWTLDAGLWTLDDGRWTLDAVIWTLKLQFGRWALDTGHCRWLFQNRIRTQFLILLHSTLPETEDHINSFQVDHPSPHHHLKTFGFLYF